MPDSTSPVGLSTVAQTISTNSAGTHASFSCHTIIRVSSRLLEGELAITCDLIPKRGKGFFAPGRNGLRQLMSALREHGTGEFGVLATSYGGWIGALLAMVERDLRFVALMAPL